MASRSKSKTRVRDLTWHSLPPRLHALSFGNNFMRRLMTESRKSVSTLRSCTSSTIRCVNEASEDTSAVATPSAPTGPEKQLWSWRSSTPVVQNMRRVEELDRFSPRI